jgi:Transmembrane domain of unknown function (DUF3566)
MSDRTQGSVRTESPAGDGAAPAGTAPAATPPAATPPASATQAIPTTGSLRAQAPATGSTSATSTAPATGSAPTAAPAAAPPAGGPTGGPVGAPPVPPATGSSPAATSQPTKAKDADPAAAGRGVRGRGPRSSGGRGPRRARLQLRHIDTWSALKISLVLSIAMFFIWMVAVGVLYGVLNALDVFDTLNDLFGQIGSASGDESSGDVVTPGLVFGGAAIIGAINIVLMTALCTVGTFIYNLCSDLVGGLELTLSERD